MDILDNKNKTKRLGYIDFAKGLCAFFVVISHSRCDSLNFIYPFYCYFFLPLFFIISGFLFRPQPELLVKDFLLKLLRKLVIPYILLAILGVISVKSFWSLIFTFNLNALVQCFLPIFLGKTYWFVANLIVVQLSFFCILFTFKRFQSIVVKSTVAIMGFFCVFVINRGDSPGYLPYNLDTLPLTLGYFSLGALIKELGILQMFNKNRMGILLSLFSLFVYTSIVYAFGDANINMHLNQYGDCPLKYIIYSLIGSFAIVYFSINYSFGFFIKAVGKYSLIVYCTQRTAFVLATYTLRCFVNDNAIGQNIMLSTIYVILTCIYSLVFAFLLKRFFPIVLGGSK